MKKQLIILALFILVSQVKAQKVPSSAVPSLAKEGFTKHFPQAKAAKWEKENGNFEVNFDLNNVNISAVVDSKGNVLETETEIKSSELPKGVAEYVLKNYKSKIKEAARITDAKGIVTYEAAIKGKDLIFDTTGMFLKAMKD